MQTLIFNTTTRTVKIYDSFPYNDVSKMYDIQNVPTVKFYEGFYEVIQEESDRKYPVLRVPIAHTNMVIEK